MTDNRFGRRMGFGAAYYPEYQVEERTEKDLDLMAEARFTVIRVGESTWSTWEPEDGHFDLDWLAPTLDGAHARGIAVILGTPTYAVPPWLARKYPQIAAERATGQPIGWGSRQEVDYSHAAFRFHAERVIRAVVGRYASHPAVIGYQVDNEPGLELFFNHGVFESFKDHLRHRYGDVETLNREWGLVYWSHRLSTWDDLWTPDNNSQPQYDLAWRQFQAGLTQDFIGWQADIVRGLARDDQFITTCLALDRPGLHEAKLARALEVTAGNPYYAMQDALTVPGADGPAEHLGWMAQGAWSVFLLADRLFAARGEPFLITETNAGPIGGSAANYPGWDGQWRQLGWAFAARGARMVEYWHWNTLHFGTETFWTGILPHDLVPGRVYEQIARLGADFEKAGPLAASLLPDADVGILWSVASKWGLAFQPPLRRPRFGAEHPRDEGAYAALVEPWYRGAFDAGVSVRLVHDIDLVDQGERVASPESVAAELPVLIVPALYVADDALLGWLAAYARAGGHLVIGPRTGYADAEARARLEVKPGRLAEVAQVRYQEYSNVEAIGVAAVAGAGGLSVPAGAGGLGWVDYLIPQGGEVLARYTDLRFSGWAAIVSARAERGRVTTVGTTPDRALAEALVRWLSPEPDAWAPRPESVTVTRAHTADGGRIIVVHNWSAGPVEMVVPVPTTDVLTGDDVGQRLALGAWDVRVLVMA